MSYFFVAYHWTASKPHDCYLRALGRQKRKGRSLSLQNNLIAQYRLPKLLEGDIIECQDIRVDYFGGQARYEPKGWIRRVGRLKVRKPRRHSFMHNHS